MADKQHSVMEVSGGAELAAAFDRLEAWAQSDALKTGLQRGADVVAAAARQLVPEKTGALKRAIRVRAGRKSKGSVSMLASVGKRWFEGDEFYGAFQEFGWKSGKRGGATGSDANGEFRSVKISSGTQAGKVRKVRVGSARRQIPGEHFMEYAFDEKKQNALGVMMTYFWVGIENELRKTGKTYMGNGAIADWKGA